MGRASGDEVRGWTLVRHVRSGANADVWIAARPDVGQAVLKIASRTRGERYERFISEVTFMRDTDDPGVMPLLDCELPARPSRAVPAWYAMPIAVPIGEALASAEPIEVMKATAVFAGTLARLSLSGASHRDMKPENLFVLDGRYVIGDFGLVSFPGKEEITVAGRILGPRNFLPYEMLHSPDTADGSLADVFMLAKTLWVLITKRPYPPQGQIRFQDVEVGTRTLQPHPRARALDRLIERATSLDPQARPSMSLLGQSLRAISEPEGSPLSLLDLGEEVKEREERRLERVRKRTDPANALVLFRIPEALRQIGEAVADADLGSGDVVDGEDLLYIGERDSLAKDGVAQIWTGGAAVVSTLDSRSRLGHVMTGLALEYDNDHNCVLVGAHALVEAEPNDRSRRGKLLWIETRRFHLDDEPTMRQAVDELVSGLIESLRSSLAEGLRLLS